MSFHAHTRVTDIEVERGRVRAVQTDKGRIETGMVLAAGGIWGPIIGRMAGVEIPLYPMQHLLAWTAPLPELRGETAEASHPILRHQDEALYFRQRGEGYAIGSYQHEPLLVEVDEILPHEEAPRMPSIVPWTPEHFERALEVTAEVLPRLKGVELVDVYNGMFSFTPDAFPVMGESPDVKGFWSAQAVWITHAGGVARTMAEWMDTGYPSMDMRESDIARFHPHASSQPYLRARAAQQYREVYDIKHPLQQISGPRGLRVTPFHARQVELGGMFFENAGWERPQWYEANAELPMPDFPARSGWEAREWSPIVAAEHRAARESVAVFDMTPFAKIEVSGPGAMEYLQRITSNQMDRPVGRTTYTSMLNERGGYQMRPDGHAAGTGPVPGGDGRRDRPARSSLDAPEPSRRRVGCPGRHIVQSLLHRSLGPARQGPAGEGYDVRRGKVGLPVHVGQADRRRGGAGAGGTHLVRRRARLGALCPDGVRVSSVGHPLGGRPASRPGGGGRGRLRLASPRKGLPSMGERHPHRVQSARSRARLRGPPRQGRLHRPVRADPGPGRGDHTEAVVPGARRPLARGDGQGADPGRARSASAT